jgi:hypothetical protein
MAQDNFFNEDLDFSVEAAQTDAQEFEAYMEDTPLPNPKNTEVKPATEKDKQEAAEKGKALSDEERAQQAKAAKQKEEEDARKFIEGEESDDETPANNSNPKKASKESEDSKGDDEEEGSDTDNDFEALAKDLYKVGIFTPDNEDGDELPATSEEFIERFNWEKQKVAEQMVHSFAGRHGEEYRELFNAVFVNGADPKEYVNKYMEVQNFKDMDMSDEDNQEHVVVTALRNQDWDEDDIKAEVKKLKLNADLESTAQRHHKALVKFEEARLTRIEEESRARLERRKQIDQQYATNIRTILSEKVASQDFDGIPVNKESANKAVDFLETKKWKLQSGELITDFDRVIMDLQHPQNHATKVKLALLLMKGYEPGKPLTLDLVPVAKKAVSKESNELFNFVKSKKVKASSLPGSSKSTSEFLQGL